MVIHRLVKLSILIIILFNVLIPFLLPQQVHANNISFLPTVDYYVHGDTDHAVPQSLVSADFNGDGKSDIAIVDTLSNSVNIRLGVGDGTFQQNTSYSVVNTPTFIASSDFNNDGVQDLVVFSSYGPAVEVLLGNGDGTFQQEIVTSIQESIYNFTVNDFNEDGKQDLAVVETNSYAFVLLGNGDGSFNKLSSFQLKPNAAVDNITSVDFNGDGKQDIASVDYGTNSLIINLGNGDGTFQPSSSYQTGAFPAWVSHGDLNGDGKQDLIVANAGDMPGDISVFIGNGDGTFEGKVDYIVGGSQPNMTGSEPVFITVSDMDEDGKQDIVSANYVSGDITVLFGNGDGTFQNHQDYNSGQNPQYVSVSDFNLDSKPDLVLARYYNGIGFLTVMNQGYDALPQINQLQDATINSGDIYSDSGSFTDSDSTSWTGTVDYGDGSGIQSLNILGFNFSLSHLYSNQGTYTVTVSIKDNQNAMGVTTMHIVVNAPTITPTPTPSTLNPTADSYVKQGSQNENEGSSTFLRLQSTGHNRAIVKFDESQIQNAVGNSQNYTAKLRFTITDNGNNWGSSGRTIEAHKLTQDWTEGNGFIDGNNPSNRGTGNGLTWNCATDTNISNSNNDCSGSTAWNMDNSSSWPFIGTATATAFITNNQSGAVDFDVTSDVQSFINNSSTNYGWLIKKTDEGANGRIQFGSRQSSLSPQLIITPQ